MIPAYCITCEPHRQRAAEQHFASRGMVVNFVQAIHGGTWHLASTLPFEPHRDPNYFIGPKHVGMTLSHWMLWQHIYLCGVEEALILEDDAGLAEGFTERFEECRQQLPSDWNFVYVGYLESPEVIARKTFQRVGQRIIRANELFGTHCYMVKREALPTLLRTNQMAWAPIDIQLYKYSMHHLRHYAFAESLAGQRADARREIMTAANQLHGWCRDEKMGYVYDCCYDAASKGPAVFVEVGVYGGRSFLPGAAGIGSEGTAYAIDPWAAEACAAGETAENAEWWTQNAGLEERFQEFVAAVKSSGIEPQTIIFRQESLVAVNHFADESIDVLHIDGNHRKARADIHSWWPKLRTGSLIIVDDTENEGWPEVDATLPWVRARGREVHKGMHYRAFVKTST